MENALLNQELQEEVKNFIELDVNHISLYSLISSNLTLVIPSSSP